MAGGNPNHRDHSSDKVPWPLGGAGQIGREQAELIAAGRAEAEAGVRRDIELAALQVSGELGYSQLTVERILERSGSNRARFYNLFANKEECYAGGYAAAIEKLSGRLLAAGAAGTDWAGGMSGALAELALFIEAEPLLARGVLAEVRVAGGAAMAKRKEVLERLSRAIDIARRENESRHSPPPITAVFIINAIEAELVRRLVTGDAAGFGERIPDLLYIAVSFYFGQQAASAAIRDLA